MKEPSEQLIEMLGHPYSPKNVQALLQSFGVKRMPPPNSYFNDDIIWSVKTSIRVDIYRAPKINDLTGLQYTNQDEWIMGAIHFLAPGSDDRIKAPFPGKLPKGITMSSTPDESIKAYGQPELDEECWWPGFSGRILAWRKPGINIAIEYADSEIDRVMRSYTACLIGCIGAPGGTIIRRSLLPNCRSTFQT
ncbi:hypothetical protein NLX71_24550 [Paenibacillus sp. MZ04-78.2]|uniref:hypothetical protein n=1 Tax=Paenibacillus sp. MZ04-78.2 TaxID=2962034 RepID=UPI0020B86A20|nr:hypothetical protein [Paenibacillus sp. MZ04-78.2]MCP3776420.1 hypothetical protein [Paenibacillus sp. MZ04-78.2]